MGKAIVWFAGTAMLFLIAVASLAAVSPGSSPWLRVLWIGFYISGGLSLLPGLVSLGLLARKRLTPLGHLERLAVHVLAIGTAVASNLVVQ